MIHLCVCDIHVCIIYYYIPVLCCIVYKLTCTYTQDTRWRGGSSVSVLITNLPIDYLLIIQSVSLEKVHGMVLYYLITEWKFNSVRMKFLCKNSPFTSLSQAYWWEVPCDWLDAYKAHYCELHFMSIQLLPIVLFRNNLILNSKAIISK